MQFRNNSNKAKLTEIVGKVLSMQIQNCLLNIQKTAGMLWTSRIEFQLLKFNADSKKKCKTSRKITIL